MSYESYVHYFPHALRDDAEALLQNAKKGTFLVRPSSRDGALVISLLQAKKILHLLILRRGQGFGVDPAAWKNHSLKNETFVSLELLIARLRQLAMVSEGLVRTDLEAAELTGDLLLGELNGVGSFDGIPEDHGAAMAAAAPGTPPFDAKRQMLTADQNVVFAAGAAAAGASAAAAAGAAAANGVAASPAKPAAAGAAERDMKVATPAKPQAAAPAPVAAAVASPAAAVAANASAGAASALAAATDELGAVGREELKRVLALSEQSAKESEYKGMLQPMLLDGKLGVNEVGALTDWRTRNAFTDAQHEKVLKAIGLTADEFDALKRFEPETHGAGGSSSDANLCVICLAEPRQTVFVDCGHFACCLHCAALVTMCPLCRSPSTKYIKVFS